ncbi:hypothetical protein C5167_041889 [Papaver somniferum]|nr:hypothetical protein C5167_041889 [Papaver somniferum]
MSSRPDALPTVDCPSSHNEECFNYVVIPFTFSVSSSFAHQVNVLHALANPYNPKDYTVESFFKQYNIHFVSRKESHWGIRFNRSTRIEKEDKLMHDVVFTAARTPIFAFLMMNLGYGFL